MKAYAGLPNSSHVFSQILLEVSPIAKRKSSRSVIAKLVLAASAYFLWQERNWRLFKNIKDNKIDLLVQQYEQFTILEEESINSGFARFNTIIIGLKALDEGFSSKNYVRKFLRALHPKWRAKVTTIEESKDLSSLALYELIGNIKSSDDETSTSGIDDEEYAMAIRNFKKCCDPNHLIGDCPKPPRNKDQKAFIGGSWSDSENEAEDKINGETCLMAQSSNEVTLDSSLYSDNAYSLDDDSMQIEYVM
ncbi:hypothetical protein Tco_1380138 [Tanacetum coccineum]